MENMKIFCISFRTNNMQIRCLLKETQQNYMKWFLANLPQGVLNLEHLKVWLYTHQCKSRMDIANRKTVTPKQFLDLIKFNISMKKHGLYLG